MMVVSSGSRRDYGQTHEVGLGDEKTERLRCVNDLDLWGQPAEKRNVAASSSLWWGCVGMCSGRRGVVRTRYAAFGCDEDEEGIRRSEGRWWLQLLSGKVKIDD